MANTTIAPTATPAVSVSRPAPSLESTLETQLQAALEHARRLTEMYGTQNIEVALAWETVEELQTAKAGYPKTNLTINFVRYCAENPGASEARIYDV